MDGVYQMGFDWSQGSMEWNATVDEEMSISMVAYEEEETIEYAKEWEVSNF